MNSTGQFVEVGTDGILSKSIVVEKVFDLDSIVYNYENKFELAMVHSEEPSKLRISNFLCEKEGNRLKKLIQIDYQGKRFVIQDKYTIQSGIHEAKESINLESKRQSDISIEINGVTTYGAFTNGASTNGASTNDSEKSENRQEEQKKVYIFKKLRISDPQFRNTKNVAKNFCKAFLAYLKSGQASREVLDEFQELGKKYNNCTIKRIIAHQNLGPLFRSFLKDRANDWVDESKIQDKHSHHEAIQIYQGLYGNQPDECLQSNLSSQMDASMEFDSQHFSREEPLDQSEQ